MSDETMTTPTGETVEESPEHAKFKRRVRRLSKLGIASLVMAAFGLGWFLTFAIPGLWEGDWDSVRRSGIGVICVVLGRYLSQQFSILINRFVEEEKHRMFHEVMDVPGAAERFLRMQAGEGE